MSGRLQTPVALPGQNALVSYWMGPKAGTDVVEIGVTSAVADIRDFTAVLSGRYIG